MKTGYLIDLQGVQFNTDGGLSWIHAMPVGTYQHPLYGEMAFTHERLTRLAQSVKDRVRGIDLDIDYDHKAETGEAAGWVKDAEVRPSGLWIAVEWTKSAAQKIKDKAYKYFSPEFLDEWTHPATGVTYRDVLAGGGITNRPFLKDLIPMNLSELLAATDTNPDQGGSMDPKELRRRLGLPEGASEADVVKKLSELKLDSILPASAPAPGGGGGEPPTPNNSNPGGAGAQVDLQALLQLSELVTKLGLSGQPTPGTPAGSSGGNPSNTPVPVPPAATGSPQLNQLSEADIEAYKKLAEGNPQVGRLLEHIVSQGKALAQTSLALRLSEVNTRLNTSTVGTQYAVAPAVKDKLREALLEMPKKFSDTVYECLEKIVSGEGLVPLGEKGHGVDYREMHGSATQTFRTLVEKKMSGKKMSYADAVVEVSGESPKLFEDYRREATMDIGG